MPLLNPTQLHFLVHTIGVTPTQPEVAAYLEIEREVIAGIERLKGRDAPPATIEAYELDVQKVQARVQRARGAAAPAAFKEGSSILGKIRGRVAASMGEAEKMIDALGQANKQCTLLLPHVPAHFERIKGDIDGAAACAREGDYARAWDLLRSVDAQLEQARKKMDEIRFKTEEFQILRRHAQLRCDALPLVVSYTREVIEEKIRAADERLADSCDEALRMLSAAETRIDEAVERAAYFNHTHSGLEQRLQSELQMPVVDWKRCRQYLSDATTYAGNGREVIAFAMLESARRVLANFLCSNKINKVRQLLASSEAAMRREDVDECRELMSAAALAADKDDAKAVGEALQRVIELCDTSSSDTD